LLNSVAAVLDRLGHEEVLPHFRALAPEDVQRKANPEDADDVVTVVDRRVEARLIEHLTELRPGIPVIGEEGVHESPDLLRQLSPLSPAWLVDPIDGTRNFVAGSDAFGIAVALVEEGETQAAWIHLPARRQLFMAERAGGAFLNGEQVRRRAPADARLRGAVYSRFMPDLVARAVDRAVAGRFDEQAATGCSAVEYVTLAEGEGDFVIYFRLLPWDHAPGALILTEAGGVVVHDNGDPYTPLSAHRVTILARTPHIAYVLRERLRQ